MGSQSINNSTQPDAKAGPPPVRLLLVDDNAAFAEATAEFLQMAGLDVRVAENGKDALESAEAFRPQIVLCDLMLRDSTGLDLARGFRSNPYMKDVVFALYTALSDSDIRALESEASGHVDLFFSKPLTDQKIEKLLDRVAR